MRLTFNGFLRPPSGDVEIEKVTVLIGSEDAGTLNVGRLVAGLIGASKCKDPYQMFKRTLGKSIPELFRGQGYVRLDDIELRIGENEISFKGPDININKVHFVPAMRTIYLRTLVKLDKLPFDPTLITTFLAEVVPEPFRIFVVDLIKGYICDVIRKTYVSREDIENIIDRLRLNDDVPSTKDVDLALLNYYKQTIEENDLIVVEEPSIFKTLNETIKEVQEAVRHFYSKGAYTLIETSRLATVYAINQLVSNGELPAEEVRAYYVKEDKISELEVAEGVGIVLEKVSFIADVAE